MSYFFKHTCQRARKGLHDDCLHQTNDYTWESFSSSPWMSCREYSSGSGKKCSHRPTPLWQHPFVWGHCASTVSLMSSTWGCLSIVLLSQRKEVRPIPAHTGGTDLRGKRFLEYLSGGHADCDTSLFTVGSRSVYGLFTVCLRSVYAGWGLHWLGSGGSIVFWRKRTCLLGHVLVYSLHVCSPGGRHVMAERDSITKTPRGAK